MNEIKALKLNTNVVNNGLFDILEENVEMKIELEKFIRERIYRFLLNEYDLELTFNEWERLNYP